jgi:P-type E1-E2 ATPase
MEWDAFPPEIQQAFAQEESAAENTASRKAIAVCCDGNPAAIFTFGESWRQDLHPTLDELTQSGIQYRILTGDRHFQSDAFPEGTIEAGLLPAEKCERIRDWSRKHPQLIYVGDGINDAAAMAEAPHSIAMENAASLTHATAHGWIVGNKLQPLVASIQFARKLRNRLYGNMRYALIYNIVGMGLAAAGKLHPVVAALIMVVSSAAVTWRALKE